MKYLFVVAICPINQQKNINQIATDAPWVCSLRSQKKVMSKVMSISGFRYSDHLFTQNIYF